MPQDSQRQYARRDKMTIKETIKQAGYKYIGFLDGEHVLQNLDTKELEVWVANKNHASYGLIYKNTHLEFAHSYPQDGNFYQLI